MVEFIATGVDPDGEDAEELAKWIGEWRPDEFSLEETKEVFNR